MRAMVIILLVITIGCAGSGQTLDASTEIEKSTMNSSISKQLLQTFEREISLQYRQLEIHYTHFDLVQNGGAHHFDGNEEHRLHRKLMRRHRTLARHHEEKMRIYGQNSRLAEKEATLAELHRRASRWHEERFQENGQGVISEDRQLKGIRKELIKHTGNL